MIIRIAAVCCLIGIVSLGVIFAPADAQDASPDAQGCEGLAAYLTALRANSVAVSTETGKPWNPDAIATPGADDDGWIKNEELLTMAPFEIQDLANGFSAYAEGIRAIQPPEWLGDWHNARIVYFQGLANYLTEAGKSGFVLAGFTYSQVIEDAFGMMATTEEHVTETCPTFIESLNRNDIFGSLVDDDAGTPVAASS